MTLLFNKRSGKEKRRLLRKNSTRAEVYLWARIRNKQLGFRFLRQYGVGEYIIDFYSPKLKLAIEIDGVTHLTKDEIEYDERRQLEIEQLGIVFIRFSNTQIFHEIENVIEKLSERISSLQSGC